MSASDRVPGPAGKPGDARDGERKWQEKKGSSNILLFGIVFLLMIALLVAAVGAGLLYIGKPMLDQYRDAQRDAQRGYSAGGMPAAPTIIARPDVAPNMFIREKLKETSEIVGLWESTAVRTLSTSSNTNNYNLTIYNDHTYIIYDKSRDTYVVGTWSGGPVSYGLSEPGKDFPSRLLGSFDSLEFQYDVNGNDYTDKSVFVDYQRVYYPGFSHDLAMNPR